MVYGEELMEFEGVSIFKKKLNSIFSNVAEDSQEDFKIFSTFCNATNVNFILN